MKPLASSNKNPNPDSENETDWHRTVGLILWPLFYLMGGKTNVEVDLSYKKQLADIIVVLRESKVWQKPDLPKDFWQAFDNFKEHNIITFKSYSESFNEFALEELYGHLINYCKGYKVKRDNVGLYAITHHYPRALLKPFLDANMVDVVKDGEIYDLNPGGLSPLRIIVCRTTDNPLLGLFSGNWEKVKRSYRRIHQESNLLDEVSVYLKQIQAYYGEGVDNMYTREDFLRDYPPGDTPVKWPWEDPMWEATVTQVKQQGLEQGLEQGFKQGLKQGLTQGEEIVRNTIVQILQMRFDIAPEIIKPSLKRLRLDELDKLANSALSVKTTDEFLLMLSKFLRDNENDKFH